MFFVIQGIRGCRMDERLGSQRNASLTPAHMRRWMVDVCLFSPEANGSLIATTSSHRVQRPINQCARFSSPLCPTRSDAQTRTKEGGKAMRRMSHGAGIGHFLLPAAASAAFFSSAIWREGKWSEMVPRASPAQHTFSLLLTHDVGGIFLKFLKFRARHVILRLLFEGVSHLTEVCEALRWSIKRRT